MSFINHVEKTFTHGIVDQIEDSAIPDGAASASKNWLTKGDSIELRRGYAIKGTRIAGTDNVTGIHVGQTVTGNQVLFWSYLRKLLYFDEGLSPDPDHAEISSDLFPAAASGEDVSFANYSPVAGAQVWISSPNGGYFKIMVNGGKSSTVAPDGKDNYDAAKNFKGLIIISLNRAFLWGRPNDRSGLYLSFIDEANLHTVTGESFSTGNGSQTYAATLSSISAKRTCYAVAINHASENFTDNFDGTLTGTMGGTGTVNYSTGAVSVTFAVAPGSGAITADYEWEDSTDGGIADFTFNASSRIAGSGAVFRQDEAGSPIQRVGFFKSIAYVFHKVITYTLDLSNDDTNATNLPYRTRVGIPNWRSAVPTGSGIYYIDDSDESNPRVRQLVFDTGGQEVIPVPVSSNIKLADYRFDKAAGIEWEDYILFSCRTSDSPVNNRVLAYNKVWKAWDALDYYVSAFDIYNGALIGGDSLSPNAQELFSGFDDDENTIDNFWEGKLSDLNIRELKKSRELIIRGLIQNEQSFDVYLELDNSEFVFIGTIAGDGPYVDTGVRVSIGSTTIGKKEIGGGGNNPDETASPYVRRLRIRQLIDKFERVKVKYVATGLGFVSVSEREFHDISRHGERLPAKYRTNNT